MVVNIKFLYRLVFFISINYCGYASAPIFKGKVIDNVTKEAIPFSNVTYVDGSFGVYSDIDGQFEIDIKGQEYLVVSCVGYKRDTIKIAGDKLGYRTIALEPITATLNEVVVKASKFKNEIRIGFFKKKNIGGMSIGFAMNKSLNLDFGHELVTILKYDSAYAGGLIKNLNLRGHFPADEMKLALRVKLYKGIGDEYSERDLLLNENAFAINQFSKARVMTIDLEKFYILLPEGGVRVVIEFLGLFDHEMKRQQGPVWLESANELTLTPKSFLRNVKSGKEVPTINDKGRYHNVSCWLHIFI